ncbi:NACHT, LRR and PYD domains-containing protein 4-like isoform X2 [Artemia franciscana]
MVNDSDVNCMKMPKIATPQVSHPLKEKFQEKEEELSEGSDDDSYQETLTSSRFSLSGNVEAVKSRVNIGHQITDNRVVTISQADNVLQKFYDKRKISIVSCCQNTDGNEKSDPDEDCTLKASEDLKSYLKEQYQRHLSKLVPLPWQAEFTLRLDNLYTTLQLNSSDQSSIAALEELFMSTEKDLCGVKLLLEGPPGYGKSTLALKVALDWSEGKQYLKDYEFLFLIQLAELKTDIPSFIVEELLPLKLTKYESSLRLMLEEQDSKVILLLDGLDELNRQRRKAVIDLLKGKCLGKATVMLTSRPLPSDDEVISLVSRRVSIRGFSDTQLTQFVHSFFKGDRESANELLQLILNKNGPYRPLASCPLACLSICVLFQDDDGKLPSKVTEIHTNLVKWLIGRSLSKKSRKSFKNSKLPDKYDKILKEFGELCVAKLKNESVEFSKDEITKKVKDPAIFDMGILINTHTSLTRQRIQKNGCLLLIHNSFIEYFAAYYLRYIIDDLERLEQNLLSLLDAKRESIELLLKFLMGLLGDKAHVVIDLLHSFDLPEMTLFDLLREAGATRLNIRAISSLFDQDFVTVQTTTTELDGWSHILSDPACIVKSLRLQRLTKDVDSEAMKLFFDHLYMNQSVTEFSYQSSYGLVLDPSDMEVLSEKMEKIINKPNLQTFTIRINGDNTSHSIVRALSQSLRSLSPTSSLSTLIFHIDLESRELDILCQALNFCCHITKLHLSKLSCGPAGYESLSRVVKYGKLESLKLSLNLFKTLPICDNEVDYGSPEDLRRLLPRLAETASKVASFTDPEASLYEQNTHTVTSISEKQVSCGSAMFLEQVELTTPACSPSHHKSGFHYLLSSLTTSTCLLKHLDLSNCYLTKMDLNCLGEGIVLTVSLEKLTLVGLESFDQVTPILQGLSATKTVSDVDLSSKKISIDDWSLQATIKYLKNSRILKKLNLMGWNGNFENVTTLAAVASYFENSSLESLDLSNCKFHVKLQRPEKENPRIVSNPQNGNNPKNSASYTDEYNATCQKVKQICESKKNWKYLSRLSLESTEVFLVASDEKKILIKGPDMPVFLCYFTNLKELNLSGFKFHKTDALAQVLAHKMISLNDQASKKFFIEISKHFGSSLETLYISNWNFTWACPEVTHSAIIKSLKQCRKLKSIFANSVVSETVPKFSPITSFIAGMPKLIKLSLEWCQLTNTDAIVVASKLIKYWKGDLLHIQTRFVNDDFVDTFLRLLKLTGRFRVESLMQGQIKITRKHFCISYCKTNNK